ncbi:MAG: ABC transporter substrate-binding protein [Desulfobacterales bacterium]|jgi:branched-chain amino acid transport system substrate-binding protein
MRIKLFVLLLTSFMAVICFANLAALPEAAAAEPLRIGAVYDLTGGLSVYGSGSNLTAKAAIDRINKAGGIAGRSVEYFVEDGATDATTGIRKFRKLVMKDGCDFMLMSCNSGLGIGTVPIAKKLNTVFFTEGTARSLTGEKGNRYTFRQLDNAEMAALAMAQFAAEELGQKAYGLGADYEWGHSVVDTAEQQFAPLGIKMLGKDFSPIGTVDFIPYLSKIPKETDFIVAGYFTADVIKLVNQAWELGLRIPIFVGTLQSIRYEDLGPGADLVWCGTYGSRNLDGFPDDVRPFQEQFRKIVGLDASGWDPSGKLSADYIWAGWEGVYWIKKGIEQSGWKSKKDNLKFIQALEGAQVQASVEFPQGSKVMRAEDHQVVGDVYIIKAEKGEIITKACMRGKDLLPLYPANVDYTKEKVR